MTEQKPGLRIRTKNLRDQMNTVTEQVLLPGDEIVYQVTHEVEYGNNERMWVRFGTGTTVRPDESTEQAVRRLVDFVHVQAVEACKQAVESTKAVDASAITP